MVNSGRVAGYRLYSYVLVSRFPCIPVCTQRTKATPLYKQIICQRPTVACESIICHGVLICFLRKFCQMWIYVILQNYLQLSRLYNNYGGVLVPPVKIRKKRSYVGLTNSYVGGNISHVGLIISYVGDTVSYVGHNSKSYVWDIISYVGVSKPYVGLFFSFFSHVALIRHRSKVKVKDMQEVNL